jgi:phenylacetaldehyde dehydrogenase
MPYPALPEGGRKASGYGRDLSEQSFESYLDTKSVLLRY